MNIWQIAAGDGTRDYSKVFLTYGVILVGPGNPGDYFENKSSYNSKDSWAYRDYFPSFPEYLDIEDLVVLKVPHGRKWKILAVGKVNSEYKYINIFEDVEGWDLNHGRFVDWKIPENEFITSGFRRGTFYGVNNKKAKEAALELWNSGTPITTEKLPNTAKSLSDEEFIDTLISKGLSVNNAEDVTNAIWKIRRLAKWYNTHGSKLGEHEIRTFLIIPLLIALGWSEQRIKIELNNIDISLYDGPFDSEQNVSIIIESKRLWDGLRFAPKQVQNYAKKYPDCNLAVVTDGVRYKLFEKNKDDWDYSSYANLLSLKKRHPHFEDIKGAENLFLKLLAK